MERRRFLSFLGLLPIALKATSRQDVPESMRDSDFPVGCYSDGKRFYPAPENPFACQDSLCMPPGPGDLCMPAREDEEVLRYRKITKKRKHV